MAPGGTPDAAILLPPVNANPPVTLMTKVSAALPVSRTTSWPFRLRSPTQRTFEPPAPVIVCEVFNAATLRVHGGLPPEVQRNVLHHEGAHYRESRRSLEERDLQREIEDLHLFYAEAMAGDPLHERVRRKLQSFLDGIHDEQQLTVDEAMPIHIR